TGEPQRRRLEQHERLTGRRAERRRPGGPTRATGDERHRAVHRAVALDEHLVERTDGAEVEAHAQHVERHTALIEVDEEAAEEVVDGVDVVEQRSEERRVGKECRAGRWTGYERERRRG